MRSRIRQTWFVATVLLALAQLPTQAKSSVPAGSSTLPPAVTLAPPSVQTTQLIPSGLTINDAAVGISVSVSGDTLVVGAPRVDVSGITDAGAAYVYTLSGGSWIQQQMLTASDPRGSDYFGSSVAISGDTIVVGSMYNDFSGKTDAGAIYVFVRNGNVWSQQQKLVASDGLSSDHFGSSVAIDGDYIVAGANQHVMTSAPGYGAAYVFARAAGIWSQQQSLTSADRSAGDQFGNSVAISNDTIVVGAPNQNVSGVVKGAALVFVRAGSSWEYQQRLLAADGLANDYFGCSVGISGDSAIVGAIYKDTTAFDSGAAYVFSRSGTIWSQEQKLAPSTGNSQYYGSSVAISANAAVVGAYNATINSVQQGGVAATFYRAFGTWTQTNTLTKVGAFPIAQSDAFGYSVAIDGSTVAVGAPNDHLANVSGSAYAFTGMFNTDAPVANAGPDRVLGACDVCAVAVTLDGTLTTDGSATPLQFTWKEGLTTLAASSSPTLSVYFPLGHHAITLTVTNGFGASSTDTVIIDVMSTSALAGAPGPAGPQGPQGEKGDTGAQGLQGEKGDKGDKGDTGATGATGATGLKGDKGDTGATGAKGDKGDAGATGATGATGETGAAGAKGDKGDTGATGAKGDMGDTGATGAKGDKGDTGATGATGVTGETGAAGAKGDIGATGAAGAKGDKGDTGVAGAPGAAGVKGDKGDAGATGAKGDTGATGAAGAKGDKGETGAPGATGAPSAKGDKGDPGAAGAPGVKGDKGDTGAVGGAGATGAAGPKGDKGDTGAQGPAGAAATTPTGALLFLQDGVAPPAGYVRVGSYKEERVDLDQPGGKKFNLTIVMWKKQ